MKTYWKLVLALAAVTTLLCALTLRSTQAALLTGLAIVLAAGGGAWLAPAISRIALEYPCRGIAVLAVAGALTGAGAFVQSPLLAALGLAGLVVLPLARMAETLQAEALQRSALSARVTPPC